jgi:hypothetical protein
MTIGEVAQYLIENYYSKYTHPKLKMQVPDINALASSLHAYQDKVLVMANDGQIEGIAVYLTLTDKTYKALGTIDICDVDNLRDMLKEDGRHVHFILVTAKGIRIILQGLNVIKKTRKPKSISWWNPSMTRIHKYQMN